MLLGVQNDPIVGNEGVAAVAATVINAGTTSKRVMWQGIGHGASIYSAVRAAAGARATWTAATCPRPTRSAPPDTEPRRPAGVRCAGGGT